jgi:hypothetical protein
MAAQKPHLQVGLGPIPRSPLLLFYDVMKLDLESEPQWQHLDVFDDLFHETNGDLGEIIRETVEGKSTRFVDLLREHGIEGKFDCDLWKTWSDEPPDEIYTRVADLIVTKFLEHGSVENIFEFCVGLSIRDVVPKIEDVGVRLFWIQVFLEFQISSQEVLASDMSSEQIHNSFVSLTSRVFSGECVGCKKNVVNEYFTVDLEPICCECTRTFALSFIPNLIDVLARRLVENKIFYHQWFSDEEQCLGLAERSIRDMTMEFALEELRYVPKKRRLLESDGIPAPMLFCDWLDLIFDEVKDEVKSRALRIVRDYDGEELLCSSILGEVRSSTRGGLMD